MNITTLFYETARDFAKKAALVENDEEVSYKELADRIEKLSVAFREIGIKENDKVALILPNSSEFMSCFLALLKINAIVSPLSPEITPYELKGIFNNLKPHAIISIPILIDRVGYEYSTLLDNKICVVQGNITAGNQTKKYFSLNELYGLRLDAYDIMGDRGMDGEQVATVNYTYRGTGHPLGAMLSHSNYIECTLAYLKNTRMSSQHRVLSFLPLSHVYPLVGCMLAPILCGATVIISKNYLPRAILKIIDDYQIDYLTAVPSIYLLLLRNNKRNIYDLSSLTCCLTGGAYMPQDVQEAVKNEMGVEVLQGYGLTESLLIAINPFGNNKRCSLGLPFKDNFRFLIVGENGVCMKANEIGEIAVNSPTVMRGYYNQKKETDAVLKNGWLYTGDYGCLDDEGYLYFTGLKKKVANVGGNLVDLKEVQNILLSHPLVSDASVDVREDDLWGHVVEAKVVSKGNGELTENEIKSFCSAKISRYKIPKVIRFTKEVLQR